MYIIGSEKMMTALGSAAPEYLLSEQVCTFNNRFEK